MRDIFISSIGRTLTSEESACLDKLISMMMCLWKQNVLRKKLHNCN